MNDPDFVRIERELPTLSKWNELVLKSTRSLDSLGQMVQGRSYCYYQPDGLFYEKAHVPSRLYPLRRSTTAGIHELLTEVQFIFSQAQKMRSDPSRNRLAFLDVQIRRLTEKLNVCFSGLQMPCKEKEKQEIAKHVVTLTDEARQFREVSPILFEIHAYKEGDNELYGVRGFQREEPFSSCLATLPQLCQNVTFREDLTRQLAYVQAHRASLEAFITKARRIADLPWRIACTAARNLYFHYGIPIDSQRGSHKHAKAAFSFALGKTVAKLSSTFTLPLEPKNYAVAMKEDEMLYLCRTQGLVHIVQVIEVIWQEITTKQGVVVFRQIIYEQFCANGPLSLAQERLFQEKKSEKVLLEVVKGVAALHKVGIVHGDLKDGNVFLDENDVAYIGDFGFARKDGELMDPAWSSPLITDPLLERQKQVRGGSAVKQLYHDIWSLGIIFYLSLFQVKRPPWLFGANENNFASMTREKRNALFPEPPREALYKHLCWRMLQLDYKLRPTAEEVLAELTRPKA